MQKDVQVLIRATADERDAWKRAAKREGKGLSEWLRDLGAQAIAPPKPAVELYPKPNGQYTTTQGKPEEYRAPSFGLDAGKFLAERGLAAQPINVGAAPIEEVEHWFPELQRMASKWTDDPGSVAEELLTATGGEQCPGRYAAWARDRKQMAGLAEWLDREYPRGVAR